jgi:hypothetical protein
VVDVVWGVGGGEGEAESGFAFGDGGEADGGGEDACGAEGGGGVEGGGGGARFSCCRCGERWGRPVLRARPGEGERGVAAGGVGKTRVRLSAYRFWGPRRVQKAGSGSMVGK